MDAMREKPDRGASPEPRRGDGLFIVVDLGVGQAAAVVGVDEPVARSGALDRWCLATSVDAPAATGGNAGDLLHVDVGQLTRPAALITRRWLRGGGAVASVETAATMAMQDGLDRRGSQAELVGEVGCTPAMSTTQRHHLPLQLRRRLVGRPTRPAGPVEQSVDAFGEEPVALLANGLGIDLEPLRGRFDRPALINNAGHHPSTTSRGQHRVRVLLSSVSHEPS